MKEKVHDIDLIEKFLDGLMTDTEKKEFEAKRTQDEEFKSLLTDMDALVEGVKNSAIKTTKEEKLERLKFFGEIVAMDEHTDLEEKQTKDSGKVVPFYRKPSVLAAAASVALLVAVTVFMMRDQAPLNERLYTAYFEPFDSPGSGLTRGSNEVPLKAQAYDAYDNARYEEAIPLFKKLLAIEDSPIIHLCLGNALLKTGQYVEAEEAFNHMLSEHSDLVTQTKWYLALTYLKENKMERAKATLWEISKSSTYGEKAKKLLKELE